MDYGMDYGIEKIYPFFKALALLCSYLLTNLLTALPCICLHSCSLLKVVGLKSHMHIQLLTLILHSPVPLNQGQRKHFSFGQKYSGAIIMYVCAGLGNGHMVHVLPGAHSRFQATPTPKNEKGLHPLFVQVLYFPVISGNRGLRCYITLLV